MVQSSGELTRQQHIEVLEEIAARPEIVYPMPPRNWVEVLATATSIGEAAVHALGRHEYAEYHDTQNKKQLVVSKSRNETFSTIRLNVSEPGSSIWVCTEAFALPAAAKDADIFQPHTKRKALYVMQSRGVQYPLRSHVGRRAYDSVMPQMANYIINFLTQETAIKYAPTRSH